MSRLALIFGLLAGSLGFWAGHLQRPIAPGPAQVLRFDAPVASPVPPRRARIATVDVPIRSPWLHRGDHVDVLAALRDPYTNEQVTTTMVQNVAVEGVEQRDDRTWRLSLLVIPEEAELLLEAEGLGTVDVTLRNTDDVDLYEDRGRSTIGTVLSGERMRVLQQKRLNALEGVRR